LCASGTNFKKVNYDYKYESQGTVIFQWHAIQDADFKDNDYCLSRESMLVAHIPKWWLFDTEQVSRTMERFHRKWKGVINTICDVIIIVINSLRK